MSTGALRSCGLGTKNIRSSSTAIMVDAFVVGS
jgi:hypothetical protein